MSPQAWTLSSLSFVDESKPQVYARLFLTVLLLLSFTLFMTSKFPDKRGHVYTKTITIKCEPELYELFERIKVETRKDVPEAQRIALRELAQVLTMDSQAS